MRIISGTARGKKLKTVDDIRTRPTADRTKEALFSIIADKVSGSSFLDLFCGSGAIGIEALSRGAASTVFVDSNKACIDVAKINIKDAKLTGHAEFFCGDAKKFLNSQKPCNYDIIFIDPPYFGEFVAPILSDIVNLGLLNDGGMIIIETAYVIEHEVLESIALIAGLEIIKTRKYGKASLIIINRTGGS